jgi:hypothetical protein
MRKVRQRRTGIRGVERDELAKRRHANRVEGGSGLVLEQRERAVRGPGLAIDTVGSQGVVDIGDGQDADREVEFARRGAVGMALAVERS